MTTHHRGGPRTGTVKFLAAATAILVASTILSGCSSQAKALDLPAQNVEQWVMPLDSYGGDGSSQGTYAELLLVKPCLEKSGYSWNVPWQDPDATSPTTNAVDRRIFTAAIAAEWGYHMARVERPNQAEWDQFSAETATLSDDEFTALRACQVQARNTLPVRDQESNYQAALVNAAIEAAQARGEVTSAAAAWRTCMEPQGISDLSKSPYEMPTESVRIEYGIEGRGGSASAEESAVAVFDFNCQVSSGYRQASYAAEWEEQVKLLDQNLDALELNRAQLDKSEKAVAGVIAANAPSR